MGTCIQISGTYCAKNFKLVSESNDLFNNITESGSIAYLINKEGCKKVIDFMENKNNVMGVSEHNIFKHLKSKITKPYFSYYYYKDVKSTIRPHTKGAHALQTYSKLWWDRYYERNVTLPI